MTLIDIPKISQIYDYVRDSSQIQRADGAIVFGRSDPRVAKSAAELFHSGMAEYLIFTGGIGKDSNYLAALNNQIPEAHYLASLALGTHEVPPESIYIEPTARNGAECTRKSLGVIVSENLPHEPMTLVVHPTSARRVRAVTEHEAASRGINTTWQTKGSEYSFNPSKITDQREAVYELIKIAEWSEKGWANPQEDLPLDLVEYARELQPLLQK